MYIEKTVFKIFANGIFFLISKIYKNYIYATRGAKRNFRDLLRFYETKFIFN